METKNYFEGYAAYVYQMMPPLLARRTSPKNIADTLYTLDLIGMRVTPAAQSAGQEAVPVGGVMVRDGSITFTAYADAWRMGEMYEVFANAAPVNSTGQEAVAWQVHPFDYGIGSKGVYARTDRIEQVEAWKRKGWNVEPLYLHPAPVNGGERDIELRARVPHEPVGDGTGRCALCGSDDESAPIHRCSADALQAGGEREPGAFEKWIESVPPMTWEKWGRREAAYAGYLAGLACDLILRNDALAALTSPAKEQK